MKYNRSSLRWWVALVGAWLAAAATILLTPLNHDVGLFLYDARRVLAGDRLYVDLIEINPPLIVWLSMPIVGLEQLIGTPPALLYRLTLLGVLSLACAWVVARVPSAQRHLPWLLVALGVIPGFMTGQREQWIAILFLPLLATVVRDAETEPLNPRTRFLAGALAGLAVGLKPFYAAIWLAVRARPVLQRGPDVREVGALVVGLTYVAAVLLFSAAYLETLRLYAPLYAEFSSRAWYFVLGLNLTILVPLLPLLLVVLVRPGLHPWPRALAMAALGAVAAVILQQKGWYYHWLVVQGFGVAALAALVQRSRVGATFGILSLVAAGQAAFFFWDIPAGDRMDWRRTSGAVTNFLRSQPDRSFAIWSSALWDAHPSAYLADGHLTQRAVAVWVESHTGGLPAGQRSPAEEAMYRAIADPFVARPPRWLLVEPPDLFASRTGKRPLNWYRHFGADSAVARTFAQYDSVGTAGRLAIWRRRSVRASQDERPLLPMPLGSCKHGGVAHAQQW
ncbi:MAG: hypothetical protein ACREOF_16405 [Gemmatimonadales bacterium]